MEEDGNGGPVGWVESHPLIGIGIVIAAVVFVVFLRAKKPATATSSTTPAGDLSGLATDAAGNHVVYIPVTDYFNNLNTYNNSNNTTTTVGVTTGTQPPLIGQPILGGTVPLPPVHAPIVAAPPPASTKGQWISTYRVVSGDTLSAIAARFKTDWMTLYSHNRNTVNTDSQQHGNPIAGGFWNNIFPGEVLSVPSLS